MQSRNILFTAVNKAELVTMPVAEPGPGELLVETAVSTISSGTERSNLTGEVNVAIFSHDTEAHFPRWLGYSSAGTVRAVGSGVTKYAVGDRVAVAGGHHAEYQVIREDMARPLADNVSFEDAALFFIGSFSLAGIRKCRTEMGEAALVMGQGILGQIAVILLRLGGAAPIIAADPLPEKRARALELGADYALDPFDPGFTDEVKRIADGGVPVVLEITGSGPALDQVLDVTAPRGRVALVGCSRTNDYVIDFYHKVHGPGISLIGANNWARPQNDSAPGWWTNYDDVMTQMRYTALGRMRLSDLVEETHSPEEAPEVYRRLATEHGFPAVQFDWRRLSK